jgi:hypothetical protein
MGLTPVLTASGRDWLQKTKTMSQQWCDNKHVNEMVSMLILLALKPQQLEDMVISK